ncbi:hypothetical protein F1880_008529 [Penicillium rolfsii]|nr:hypothetical protein F1880_008529 [Penicillium rolfsii]
MIQRKPRPTSPHSQSYPSSQPANSRPQYAEFLSHNSIRERINRRKRNHSPEATRQPRSRNVRFAEDHEEIGGPVHFSSDSDSDSSTDSDSDSSGRASTQPRPRSRSPPRVVVVQPQRESSATIVERSPRDSGTGGVMRGSSHRGQERVRREGVMYEYREPRDQRRVRDFRRYV